MSSRVDPRTKIDVHWTDVFRPPTWSSTEQGVGLHRLRVLGPDTHVSEQVSRVQSRGWWGRLWVSSWTSTPDPSLGQMVFSLLASDSRYTLRGSDRRRCTKGNMSVGGSPPPRTDRGCRGRGFRHGDDTPVMGPRTLPFFGDEWRETGSMDRVGAQKHLQRQR